MHILFIAGVSGDGRITYPAPPGSEISWSMDEIYWDEEIFQIQAAGIDRKMGDQ